MQFWTWEVTFSVFGDRFWSMERFTSFFLSIKASVVFCSWLMWMPAPQSETRSFKNDLSCQRRGDETTVQYAAVWLPTCAPYTELNHLNQLTSTNPLTPSKSFLPPKVPALVSVGDQADDQSAPCILFDKACYCDLWLMASAHQGCSADHCLSPSVHPYVRETPSSQLIHPKYCL